MSNGLKNIQSHARAYSRRERLESGQSLDYDDDSGVSGISLTSIDDSNMTSIDDSNMTMEYYSPEPDDGFTKLPDSISSESKKTDWSRKPMHGYISVQQRNQSFNPYMGRLTRLPSLQDMGISSLINIGSVIDMVGAPSTSGKNQESAYSSSDIKQSGDSSETPIKHESPTNIIHYILENNLGSSSTSLPTQKDNTSIPAIPDKAAVKTPEMGASQERDSEPCEASDRSSPSTAMTTSSNPVIGPASESSTGMSYSFIQRPSNRLGMLDCVVQWLEQWIDQQFQGFVSGCCSGAQAAGHPPTSGPSNDDNKISEAMGQRRSAKGKRPAEDDAADEDSDKESRRDPKRPKPDSSVFGSPRRFACPFFKRHPTRYQEARACSGPPGFKTIHRLKYVPLFACCLAISYLLTAVKENIYIVNTNFQNTNVSDAAQPFRTKTNYTPTIAPKFPAHLCPRKKSPKASTRRS